MLYISVKERYTHIYSFMFSIYLEFTSLHCYVVLYFMYIVLYQSILQLIGIWMTPSLLLLRIGLIWTCALMGCRVMWEPLWGPRPRHRRHIPGLECIQPDRATPQWLCTFAPLQHHSGGPAASLLATTLNWVGQNVLSVFSTKTAVVALSRLLTPFHTILLDCVVTVVISMCI